MVEVESTVFDAGTLNSHDEDTPPREERVTLVDANPDAGFNYPYFLATPAEFREGPIPLLVEMNNADEGLSKEVETGRARGQITSTNTQGSWLSEELGVPHLKPVFHEPDGDPVDAHHEISLLDRDAMTHKGSKLERVDRQLLRMADHAREVRLSDRPMHEKLLFYGNSSEGVVSERMAAMHPERMIAASGSGLNGFVLLPLEELGDHTLRYPVGVADFEEILGKPHDPETHDTVDMFYIEGGQDPKNRLKMEGGLDYYNWDNEQIYYAARAVYGPDKVEDRFPRCHIAFEKAGIDAQFRVYPEMTHDPRPASHDLLEFFEKSLGGEDVSEFGQRFELPLDRTPVLTSQDRTSDGIEVEFEVSGSWPPPEGLVFYSWDFDDGATGSGLATSHTFPGPGSYEVSLVMETPHGQRNETTVTHTFYEVSNIQWSTARLLPGESVSATADIKNPGDTSATIELGLLRITSNEREVTASKEITLGPAEAKSVRIEEDLFTPGEYFLAIDGQPISDPVTVRGDPNKRISFITELPDEPIEPRRGVSIRIHVVFTDVQSQGTFRFPILINGRRIAGKAIELEPNTRKTIAVEHTFEEPGEYRLATEVSRQDRYLGNVTVAVEATPTSTPTRLPTSAPSPSETATASTPTDSPTATPGQPGFGVISAVAGIGSAAGYFLSRKENDE